MNQYLKNLNRIHMPVQAAVSIARRETILHLENILTMKKRENS